VIFLVIGKSNFVFSQIFYDSLVNIIKLDIDSAIKPDNLYDYFYDIASLHQYHRLKNNIYIGNSGLPILELSLNNNTDYRNNDYNLSIINIPVAKKYFLRSTKPVTDFFYLMGSFKEQYLNLIHIQPIGKNASFFVSYNKIKSEGFYKNQLTDNNNLFAGFEYRHGNYISNILFNYSNINFRENGGISDDSLFRIDFYSNSRLYNVNLNEAKNKIKGYNISVLNNFNLTKDTLNRRFNLYHRLSFNYYSRLYTDNPGYFFYDNIFLDSTITNDRYYYQALQNNVGLNFVSGCFSINASVKSSLSNYANIIDTSTHIISSGIYMGYFKKALKANFNGEYFFTGYKAGNYNLRAHIDYYFKSVLKNINLHLYSFYDSPPFDYRYIYANNFYWENNFRNTRNSGVRVRGNLLSEFKFDLSYTLIDNFIYLDTNSLPKQNDFTINYFNFSLNKNFDSKYFSFTVGLNYQNVLKGGAVLRLPDYIGNALIYYKNSLWSMKYQIGAQVFYYASFYSNAYNPALNSFYLQNKVKTGAYPYIDFFFKAAIKNVKLLLMITHLNEGFTGTNYYSTILYPMPGRAFKIGLNWTFIN
jgi:hypothetical protein